MKNSYMNVYGSIIHKTQKLETIRMSVNLKMDFKMLYIHTMNYCLAIKRMKS